LVEVPEMQFIRIDGIGDPGTSDANASAVAWLYATSYPIKFVSKTDLGRDYTVPPLEGIWWADDIEAFSDGNRDAWQWTMMIQQPDWIDRELFERGGANRLTRNLVNLRARCDLNRSTRVYPPRSSMSGHMPTRHQQSLGSTTSSSPARD
jgi:hypothetical protein